MLIDLNGVSIAAELEAALGKAGDVRPRIVHDHGSEYVNRDMRALIQQHNLLEIRTRARHPESNGIVERFNASTAQCATRRLTSMATTTCRHARRSNRWSPSTTTCSFTRSRWQPP
jgi:transposase InsO family protein